MTAFDYDRPINTSTLAPSQPGLSAVLPQMRDRTFAFALTSLYAAWLLFVCFHHEPWRDEADVWLAVRDMSPGELFRWLGSVGSPGLWYMLVMPLAKMGLPYGAMFALHAVLAVGVAGLVAFCSPFSRVFKILIVFSYYVAFEYAVVARSYVLTALLLFLIAIVMTARVKRYWLLGALLFLLFNANAHGFFIAGIISVAVAIDLVRKREFSRGAMAGAAIAAIGGIAALLQLLPPAHANPPTMGRHWMVAGNVLSQAMFPHVPTTPGDVFDSAGGHAARLLASVWSFAVHWAGALVFLSALLLMRRRRDVMAIVVLSWVALLYIGIFKWYQGERHAGLFFVVMIFGLWVSNSPGQTPRASRVAGRGLFDTFMVRAVATALCISCAVAALWSYRELRLPYSGARATATFIDSHALAAVPIATVGLQAEALAPYLPGSQFWYAGPQEFATYTRWERNWQSDGSLSESEILSRVQHRFAGTPHLLLIATKPLSDAETRGYRLIFQNSRDVFGHADEMYFLYTSAGSIARTPRGPRPL